RPDRGLTIQLGNGVALAARLGIPVVYDFRAADVAAGGHGAPMVPVFHRAMLRLLKRPHPVGVLNLGGVANVNFINDSAELVACDTGPGNALIDDFVRVRGGQPQDDEGRTAAAGKVDEDAVARVLTHPFFSKPPPKSLDRNAFRHWVAEEGRLAAKSTQDGAATLTAITAASVACATTLLPRPPGERGVRGGAPPNTTLRRTPGPHPPPPRRHTPPPPLAGRPMRSRRGLSPLSRPERSAFCRPPFPPRPACRGR